MDNDQLLRNILLTGTPRETETFFIAHHSDVNACRALATASRFCGLEYVRALAENGAEFDTSDVYYWLAVLEFNEQQRDAYCVSEEDDCIEVEIKRTHSDNSVEIFRLLPLEQRMEIVRYLCENSEKIHFEMGELLYFSILSSNPKITALLKERGVVFTEERIQALTESRKHYVWFQFIRMLGTLDNGIVAEVIRSVVKEVGGKRLRPYSKYRYLAYSLCDREDQFFDPGIFTAFLDNFKLSKIDKVNLLKYLIDRECLECLGICARRGWLNSLGRCDEMTAYASETEKTECVMWLLDFRNRTFDIAAERAKSETEALRELNSPNSISAMRKLWRWRKQDDGTLMLTYYKGDDTVIKVPSKIGKRAVTAVGRKTFAYHEEERPDELEINRIILPGCIRSIGANAFSCCASLEEIVIPENVDEIGEGVFIACKRLTEVNIPVAVKEIEDYLFAQCINLRSVNLPAGIKRIGNRAFKFCLALKEPVIPEGTEEIGDNAFKSCRSLTVVIPASVTKIGEDIFQKAESATVVVEQNSFAEKYCKENGISFRYANT